MLLTIGIALVVAIGAISGTMVLMEDRFIYFPSPTVSATPQTVGLRYEDRSLRAGDDVRLHAWYIPNPEARYTALDFHGNAGNLGDRVDRYAQWHRLGLAVYAVDYRGYGRSEGSPSEEGLYRDARAAWTDLTGALGVPPERVIVVGRSLGGGPATQLATEVDSAGLVLETPMTSIPAMARVVYPWLPVSFLARTKFDSLAKMRGIQSPLMVVQAQQDDVIPPWMSRKLFDAANEPKQWVSLAGGHNDFDEVSRQRYEEAWRTFLASLPNPA
jgi:fermentation-respiration switch protein FrsA (DUF1100 family)